MYQTWSNFVNLFVMNCWRIYRICSLNRVNCVDIFHQCIIIFCREIIFSQWSRFGKKVFDCIQLMNLSKNLDILFLSVLLHRSLLTLIKWSCHHQFVEPFSIRISCSIARSRSWSYLYTLIQPYRKLVQQRTLSLSKSLR